MIAPQEPPNGCCFGLGAGHGGGRRSGISAFRPFLRHRAAVRRRDKLNRPPSPDLLRRGCRSRPRGACAAG